MLISNKVIKAINEQVGNEFGASLQYVAIAAHFAADALPQLSQHFFRQGEEENEHAMRFIKYVVDAGGRVVTERLARQRAFLGVHSEIGLLGTGAREVDAAGRELRIIWPPQEDAVIRRALIRRNSFVHSSVMMRRSLVEQLGGYDSSFPVAQDYDLWLRLSGITRMANLPEPLVVRRLVPGRVTSERDSARLRAEARARWRAVRRGAYPFRCVAFALRPALVLALPLPLRALLRRALGLA